MSSTVSQVQEESQNEGKKFIYNPSISDFTANYDGVPYTVKSKELSEEWPEHIANHVKKHLIDHMSNELDLVLFRDNNLEKISKMIDVEI